MTEGVKFDFKPEELLSQMHDRVLVLTINRQKSYNAWTEALRDELTRRLIAAEQDENIDAAIVTGAGDKAFCAGQDLRETESSPDGQHIEAWIARLTACYDAIRGFSKPLIAAVNGVAAGSGFQLTQFCDYVVAHPKVRMGQTEVSSGIPSIFGTWLMWERIGSRAYELSLQGRLMEGEEAKQLGFVNELVEQSKVLDVALEAAQRFARQPRVAFKVSKEAIRKFDQERYAHAMNMSVTVHRDAFNTGAPQKDIGQFFERRRAKKADEQGA